MRIILIRFKNYYKNLKKVKIDYFNIDYKYVIYNQSIMENNIDTIVPFILEPDYQVIINSIYSNIYTNAIYIKNYESSTFIYYIENISIKAK